MNKKSITILVVCLIVTVLSVSLAYYTTRIIGTGKNVSVNAKELTINFDNNNEIAEGIIEPGWSSTNTFSVENKSKNSFTYDIVLKNYKNTTKTNGYLVYKITSTNGYNMTEYKDMPKDGDNTYDLVIARGITIETGSSNKQSYSLEIKYLDSTEDQSIDMGETVTGSLYIVESTTNQDNPYTKGTLGYQIMEDNSNIKTRTDFSTTYTDVNIGTMYKSTEDDTDVYYFAGDARNNWVKFGTFNIDKTIYIGWGIYKDNDKSYVTYDSMSACTSASTYNNDCEALTLWKKGDPIYWRIIRTNSDGSIRLLYHGNSPDITNAYIETSKYNESSNDPMYVGYMYGTSGSLENNRLNTNSSTIKKVIDTWYENNLSNYTKYLSTTAVYCNDRNLRSGVKYSTSSNFGYAPYDRLYLYNNIAPTYDCTSTEDKFTVDSSIGNGKLTYSIALMTADEVSFAGGLWVTNTSTWYYHNNAKASSTGSKYWWLLSPDYWFNSNAIVCGVREGNRPGRLDNDIVNISFTVRPAISLKGDLTYKSGNGSATNPYEIIAEPVNTYTVSLTVNNGSGTDTVLVEEGKDATFTVTPSGGYKAELEIDTCGGKLSGNTYTISNVTSAKTCSITFKSDNPFPSGTLAYKIYEKSKTNEDGVYNENGYRYEGVDPNNYIQMEKSDRTTEMWRIIGLFPDGASGEEVIRVRKVGYEKVAYDSNKTNHWPNTTLYTTLLSTYSLTNYKNTVNYKMYLGTSNKYNSYVLADYYDMERMLNGKGMAGATSKASYSSTTTFNGSVGLMYPSDYGYAVLASDCARTIKPLNYHETSKCYDNNWLYHRTDDFQLLLTPIALAVNLISAVSTEGYVTLYGDFVTDSGLASPVMALKSDVVVTGSGTQSDPYVMTN